MKPGSTELGQAGARGVATTNLQRVGASIQGRRPGIALGRRRGAQLFGGVFPIAFLLAHIPLTLIMRGSSAVATAHGYLTFFFGVWLAMASRRRERVLYWAAYVAGAEVLWRMTNANVYWEFGKYAVSSVFLLAWARRGLRGLALKPIVFFVLLLPAGILTLNAVDPGTARSQLSFNLSGPFSLMVCALVFGGFRLSKHQLYEFLVAAIAPIIGILFFASYTIATADQLSFSHGSNFVASGGFGPNQVSAMLGLGVTAGVLILLEPQVRQRTKFFLLVIVSAMLAQAALTFSRTGIYLAVMSVGAALIFQVRESKKRTQQALLFLGGLALAFLLLWPQLDAFTGGALSARFADSKTTGRSELAAADLQIWREHPLTGIGVGQAQERREQLISKDLASHTEFTRLLAEHGLFGLMAIGILFAMAYQNLRRAGGSAEKGVVAAAIVWAFAFMMVSGMRLVAPALLFGLTCATLRWPGRVARLKRVAKRSGSPATVVNQRTAPTGGTSVFAHAATEPRRGLPLPQPPS